MSKPDQNYTVIREYKNLYDMEELIRRIIRTHIGRIQEGKEKAEGAESREQPWETGRSKRGRKKMQS